MKSTKPSKKQPLNFMDIEGVKISDITYEFCQDSDSCESEDCGQSIRIFTANAGGGSFVVISTERWAMDYDDIDKFAACLKGICETPEEY